jgi:type II secretory pathway pseudopilin PulG
MNKHNYKSRNSSFTLIELMVSVAMVFIVISAIGAFFLGNQDVISRTLRRQEVQNEATTAIKSIGMSVRNSDQVNLIDYSESDCKCCPVCNDGRTYDSSYSDCPQCGENLIQKKYSTEIEIERLDIDTGETLYLRYKLSGSDLLYYPPPYSVGNYQRVAKDISSISFSDGECEWERGGTEIIGSDLEGIKLLEVGLIAQDAEKNISVPASTKVACRDMINIFDPPWGCADPGETCTHNWQYNDNDPEDDEDDTISCVDEGYEGWADIPLGLTGLLTHDLMEYMEYEDQDILSLTFDDECLIVDIDSRDVIDGVVVIMSDDSVAIAPPELVTQEMHDAFGNYNFEVNVATKIGSYAPKISFGYYTYDDEGNKVYDGSPENIPGENPIVAREEWSGNFQTPTSIEGNPVNFGFYLDIRNPNHTWHTETSENSDGFDHAWEYVSEELGTLVIGWEDLEGGGDKDHQDYVVTLKPISRVAE